MSCNSALEFEMMKWRMEILSPVSYLANSNRFLEEIKDTKWTPEENKRFETAIAVFDKDTPDRWHMVAAMIPGKTALDVFKQYKELEEDVSKIDAGLTPIPWYITSSFTLDWVNNRGFVGKRSSLARPCNQERKKGIPWTKDEHRRFLMGLKKYGKGDWRNISRYFVVSRTPTQVASHAQKYFNRQLSGEKEKKRFSIHDINLTDTSPLSPDSNRTASPGQSTVLPQQPNSVHDLDWSRPNDGVAMVFNSAHGVNLYGLLQGQNLQRGVLHGSQIGPRNTVFQMQSI
ncbi:hypothetical protein HHK36_018881 [Tetracentron sinense]|uniref:Uncharacterized protein n=1 Tax=Tetracentron sinense TaxID=13715 RepID=A0A834Z170_TETSI|nr:hypothetical protein HHK36_018881 [Tetracentron sinense]